MPEGAPETSGDQEGPEVEGGRASEESRDGQGAAQGEARIGLLVPVGVLLLAAMAVWAVFSSQEGGASSDELESAGSTSSPTDDDPPALAEAWRAPTPAPESEAESAGGADGAVAALWAGDGTVTQLTPQGVIGYGDLDGAPAWEAPAPAGTAGICAASPSTNADGLGAVVYRASGEPGECSVLAVLDTGTGELLWRQDLTVGEPGVGPGPLPPEKVRVTVGDSAVAVTADRPDEGPDDTGPVGPGGPDEAAATSAFHRFAVASGEPLAEPLPPQEVACPSAQHTLVRHAGQRVVALAECPEPNATEARRLDVYHADTGEWEWSHSAADPTFDVTDVLTGDPVLLLQDEHVVAYGETGEELWRLPAGEAEGALVERHTVVADEVLVAQHREPNGDPGLAAFAGYGLADGARLWEAELPSDVRLLGLDDNGMVLLAHQDGRQLALSWLDPATGEERPAGEAELARPLAEGRLVLAHDPHQLYVMSAPEAGAERAHLHAFER